MAAHLEKPPRVRNAHNATINLPMTQGVRPSALAYLETKLRSQHLHKPYGDSCALHRCGYSKSPLEKSLFMAGSIRQINETHSTPVSRKKVSMVSRQGPSWIVTTVRGGALALRMNKALHVLQQRIHSVGKASAINDKVLEWSRFTCKLMQPTSNNLERSARMPSQDQVVNIMLK
ncbi:hypothetical protein BDR04DRAFT_1116677 [Suillus decipiens]|nr:hypothetical protein BDR04DRAFT_1116677 [Suillus decipiens]